MPYHYRHNFQIALCCEETYQDKIYFPRSKTSTIPLQLFIPHLILHYLQVNFLYFIRAAINFMYKMICNEQLLKGFGFCPATGRIGDMFCLAEEKFTVNLSCDMRYKLTHFNIIQCREYSFEGQKRIAQCFISFFNQCSQHNYDMPVEFCLFLLQGKCQ